MPVSVLQWLALHGLLALAATWLARRYALARRLVDEPGERRSHAVATPRGGGISIVLAMLAALAALQLRLPGAPPSLWLVAAGLAAVAAVGWIDDHRPLSPWGRLAVHAVAAALLAAACLVAGAPPWRAAAAFVLAMVLVNVWNFMDGIDGLAASQALLAAAAWSFVTAPGGAAWWLCLALAAAAAGFLPFNFPRARIFLGDAGSGGIGYALAALLALGAADPPALALMLLPASAFLIDAALTLVARIVRGERWWTPHVQHLYQRLARGWGGHRGVTMAYAGWTLAAAVGMVLMRDARATTIMCAVFAWYLGGTALWLLARRYDR